MPIPNWQYYFARKYSLQRFEIVMRVFRSPFWATEFDVHIKNCLVKPGEGKNFEVWMDENEWPAAQEKVFRVVYKDLASWRKYVALIKTTQQEFVDAAREVSEGINSDTSREEVGRRFDQFIKHLQAHHDIPIWIPFATEPIVAQETERALRQALERNNRVDDFQKYFDIIFSPQEKNAITKLEEALVALARDCKQAISKDEQTERLEKMYQEFCYIPCYDVIDPPWEKEHFEDELKNLLQKDLAVLESFCEELAERPNRHKQAFEQFLRDVTLTDEERELFTMAHELVFIKDERDDYRRLGSYLARPLFAEIGQRVGLTTFETCYVSIEEMDNFLHYGVSLPSVATVKERAQKFLLIMKDDGPIIISNGSAVDEIVLAELGNKITTEVQEVKGIAASVGRAQGNVVIVRTRHELRLVTDGAIMVAVTTNPDFVPAMKKCRAIVTNEGGVTSHAAIVARELGIPCVVGAKNATSIFKDGDLVEVDADKGIVRKI